MNRLMLTWPVASQFHLLSQKDKNYSRERDDDEVDESRLLLKQSQRRGLCSSSPNHLNLNFRYPEFQTASEMYAHIRELTKAGGDFTARNFVGVIKDVSPEASVVETELFPRGALEYYTAKNMGWDYTEEDKKMWQMNERGGDQGDYRDGMPEKIEERDRLSESGATFQTSNHSDSVLERGKSNG